MIAVRQIEQVVAGTVTIRLPAHFAAGQVEVIVLPLEKDRQEQEHLQRLLLTAPMLSEDDLQGFTQVKDWMRPVSISTFVPPIG